MGARSTLPSSKIYSQALITGQTRLKPSALSYTGFNKTIHWFSWLFCLCTASGKCSYKGCVAEFTTAGWVRAAAGLNLHMLQDRYRLTCHLAQQFPLCQCLQRWPTACDAILLHRHSHSTTSCLCVTRDNSTSYCFWAILLKKQNLEMG